MLLLLSAEICYLRYEVTAGRDGARAEHKFCALLLRPFDVTGVDQAGDSWQWSFPLVALLVAQLAFFIADWLGTTNPLLTCDLPLGPDPETGASACPRKGQPVRARARSSRCRESTTNTGYTQHQGLGGNLLGYY